MGNRTITVSAIHQWEYVKTFKLATMFLAFQGMNHLVYEIVNVKQNSSSTRGSLTCIGRSLAMLLQNVATALL